MKTMNSCVSGMLIAPLASKYSDSKNVWEDAFRVRVNRMI